MLTIVLALALAQSPDPAQVVQALGRQTGELARDWLRSPDPRTQGWGAYLATRDRRAELVPDLLALLEAYTPGAPVSLAARDQHDSMMAVLDALIQLQAAAPVHDVAKISSDFPVQALLLVSHAVPRNEIAPFLMTLFESEEHNPGVWQSAGNLLAGPRALTFGVSVLESMTVRATVMVLEPEGQTMSHGIAGDCLGYAPGAAKTGWPEIGWYDFSIGANSPGEGLLAPGVDPVYFHRAVDTTYTSATKCLYLPHPDLVREHYLATVLNRPASDPPIKHEVTKILFWSNEDQYRRDLAAFVVGQQKIFSDVAAQLAPPGRAATSERPKFIVEIWDQRREETPLPEMEAGTGVTFIRTR
jgi:hypothetical protein